MSKPCPYSPSCFTCPLKDCFVTDKGDITKINRLPGDKNRNRCTKKAVSKIRAALAAVPCYSVEPDIYRQAAAHERLEVYGPLDY